jgi:hypothetical protein
MQGLLRKLPRLLCYLVAMVLGMKQLREPDVWWQLLSGRWMLEHGQVTHTDVFSYTMAGHPWVNVKWLYEIMIALIEKALGPEGVLLLQCLVNIAIVWLLFRTIKDLAQLLNRSISEFQSVLAVLLLLATIEYRMAGRPEMISHLLCAVYLFLLLRKPEASFKHIIWLLPLQCLWANMHEGYPVGLVMMGTFTAGAAISYLLTKEKLYTKQAGRLALVFLASIFIILLNPNGIVLWMQPFEIYRQVWANKYTTELYSWSDTAYWTIQARWHVAMLIVVLMYWPLKMRTADKSFYTPAMVAYLLLIPLFGYLSLTANRNIPFSQIILLPSVALILNDFVVFLQSKWRSFAGISKYAGLIAALVGLLFYISVVSNAFYKATGSVNRYGIHTSMLHNPAGAAEFIRANNIQGPAFSDYFVSSYLLWKLYPDFRSYIDLRDLDVFPVSFFEDYFKMYKQPSLFRTADDRYKFNYVVLSTSQLPATQHDLYWNKGFYMIYADPVSVIFLRENDLNKPLNSNTSIQKPFTWPAAAEDPAWATALTKLLDPLASYNDEDDSNAPVRAAMFYNQLQDYPQAISFLKPHLADLDNRRAYLTMSQVYGDYAKAIKDPAKKQQLSDSANMYMQQAAESGR